MDWRVQPMQGPPRFCCETLGFSRAFSLGYSAVAADLPVPAAVQRSVAKLLDLELGRATLDPAKQNRSRPGGGRVAHRNGGPGMSRRGSDGCFLGTSSPETTDLPMN